MKTKILLITLAMCFWMGLNQVQADLITIEISGNITSASGTSLPVTIYAGSSFTGTYTYDSSTLNSGGGHYVHDSPYGISISLGGYEFETAPNHVGQFDMWIRNDDSSDGIKDYYTVFSGENVSTLPVGFTIWYINWRLIDSTHTALFSDALPVTAPVLTDWDSNVLTIYAFDSLGYGISIYGTVTHAIPEPITGILMAVGVFLMRRKR